MRIGAIRATKCPKCEHRYEQFVRASEDWEATCPHCRTRHSTDTSGGTRFYGNTRYTEAEGESVRHGFHPAEVKLARKLMPKSRDSIRDDGRVVHPDARSARRFAKELDAAKARLGVVDRQPF